ncbi:MAG: hypothetical protein ONA69_05285 [candidate division KSB1 bacterium]|nr:hypothetical protein [candidate division KSB1 bacterium]MDZ7346192.1 hypothetical protein [candidate division KSB1 bacterium]
MIDQFDKLEIRCPMLGHSVTFYYCRTTSGDEPCRRLPDCWFERIPVHDFIRSFFSAEQQQRFFQPPPPKLVTLVELIERAKQTAAAPDANDERT